MIVVFFGFNHDDDDDFFLFSTYSVHVNHKMFVWSFIFTSVHSLYNLNILNEFGNQVT